MCYSVHFIDIIGNMFLHQQRCRGSNQPEDQKKKKKKPKPYFLTFTPQYPPLNF